MEVGTLLVSQALIVRVLEGIRTTLTDNPRPPRTPHAAEVLKLKPCNCCGLHQKTFQDDCTLAGLTSDRHLPLSLRSFH